MTMHEMTIKVLRAELRLVLYFLRKKGDVGNIIPNLGRPRETLIKRVSRVLDDTRPHKLKL